jgi:hypothetical protein
VSIQAVSPALICIKAPCTIVAAALPNPLAGELRALTIGLK